MSMQRASRRLALIGILGLGLAVVGVGRLGLTTESVQAAPVQAQVGVAIQNFAFSPATTRVNVGDTVTWTNRDQAPHTATSTTGAFDTGTLAMGQSGSHTFTQAGTYPYFCAIHPQMTGTVVVEAAAMAAPTTAAGPSTAPARPTAQPATQAAQPATQPAAQPAPQTSSPVTRPATQRQPAAGAPAQAPAKAPAAAPAGLPRTGGLPIAGLLALGTVALGAGVGIRRIIR